MPEPLLQPWAHLGARRAKEEDCFNAGRQQVAFSRRRMASGQSEHTELSPCQRIQPSFQQHGDPRGSGTLPKGETESDNCCGRKGSTFSTMCPLERKAFIWEQSKSLKENQETGILPTLHCIPSSERNCFRRVGGMDVCNSNRIINTLCIQAEQKLFALPTEICFYKSGSPPHSSSVCI